MLSYLMNVFSDHTSANYPLVWMCQSRTLHKRINRLHERCLRIIYNDKHSSFQCLLDRDKSVSIHTRNLQILATEMFKVSKGIAPKIFADILARKPPSDYNLRYQYD